MRARHAGLLAALLVGGAGVAWARGRRGTADPAPAQTTDARPVSHELSGAAPLRDRRRARAALGSGHVVAPTWEPAALTAVAAWAPAAPASRAGRVAAWLWASPLTLLGVGLALASGARPRRRDDAWVAAPARGLFTVVFARRGFAACTLGHVIVAGELPGPALLRHELVHVRQGERLGPLMAPVYLTLMGVYGYARHPLERAARAGARRAATPPAPRSGR